MLTLDKAVARISADGVVTRQELAATARLANAKRDPVALLAQLEPVAAQMTGRAADAFVAFKAGVATGGAAMTDALNALARPSLQPRAPVNSSTSPSASSPLSTRMNALAATTTQALVEKRALYQTLIDGHTATIHTLEAEVAAIHTRIAHKTNEVRGLISEQQRLRASIEEKQGMIAYLTMTAAASSLVTFGLGGLLGAGAIGLVTSELAGFRSQLADVDRRKSALDGELRALESKSAAFSQQQAQLGARLNELKAAQAELEALRQQPTTTLPQLQRAADADQRLIANLTAQIVVLQAMRASAQGHEAALDKMIAALHEEVDALENQLARTNAAVVVGLIDVALTGFGVSRALRMEGITVARKQLLTAGIDLVRGDPSAIASTLVGSLVNNGLVSATGSSALAATVTALLQTNTPNDSRAAVSALLAHATTAIQRELMTALAMETRFDVEPLAKAVLAEPALDDNMARTILAMLRA